MARARRSLTAALAAALLAAIPAAPAWALRALHVDALSMRADRAQVAVGEAFHLAIHVHVREKLSTLDELVLPDVGTMQTLGDERHVSVSPSGTDVVETLTLEPTQSGTFTFAGAYLDAIDARTGKPSRFSANSVRVVVAQPAPRLGEALWSAVRLLITVLLWALVVAAAIAAVILLIRFRRRPRPIADVAPPVVPAPRPAPRSPRDAVAEALRAYRDSPANGSLLRLRGALFAAAGASEGATLSDALARTNDAALRDALVAAEHTAFGPSHIRDASSDALIRTTEGWLR
ncbi:MAG TPA: hypothetical protein VK669_14220 [Candidatus Limnocylindrales bacterium]|nr:hypothetical protein [Candidatus Limnocylindrales bacterium]